MELVLFTGIQGSGKSSYYVENFLDTHVHISLDMLNTRNRERLLLDFCLKSGQSCVIDNTNPTTSDREKYITKALEHNFKVTGYYFESKIETCLSRNNSRNEHKIVPEKGVRGTHSKLELPSKTEGFDKLSYVYIKDNQFITVEWKDEV